jgi:hypothetical protein
MASKYHGTSVKPVPAGHPKSNGGRTTTPKKSC